MRLRIDGILKHILMFEHKEWTRYLQKLKFIAGTRMNVDYIPQDGRFDFQVEKDGTMKKIDARINFMPGIQNESTVIRYLDGTKGVQSFENI
jgi:type II secretory ATPase GspE/PulE/Tfp pilus assembly ATPase PilB-like protein